MTLSDRIKALPAIKDEAGAECVSREVVLGLVGAEFKPRLSMLHVTHEFPCGCTFGAEGCIKQCGDAYFEGGVMFHKRPPSAR